MTLEEFSNGFDALVNSYRRFRGFDRQEALDSIEFNEYEKSVFLTKAQEELVISLYNGKNPYGDSFESTEEQRRYLSQLVLDANLEPITTNSGYPLGVESSSKFFTLPDDLWFIIYEGIKVSDKSCDSTSTMEVCPVTHDEYHRVRNNPFRGTTEKRALRLDLADGVTEVVCKYNVQYYYIRYMRKPNPIILVNLPNRLTIEGSDTRTSCELHEALHERILELAVREALQSKGISYRTDNQETK